MKALTWHGKNDIRCDSMPDPRLTACAICGSDLRLLRMVELGQLRSCGEMKGRPDEP